MRSGDEIVPNIPSRQKRILVIDDKKISSAKSCALAQSALGFDASVGIRQPRARWR